MSNNEDSIEEVDKNEGEVILSIGSLYKQVKDLKTYNNELIKHNSELTDNNKFLRNMCENKMYDTKLRFAECIKTSNVNKNLQDNTTIIIKPTSSFKGATIETVKSSVAKPIKESIIDLKQGKNNEVFVKCCKKSSQNITEKLIKEIGTNVTVNFIEKKPNNKSF